MTDKFEIIRKGKQMKKKIITTLLIGALLTSTLSGCGNSSQESTGAATPSAEVTAETDAKEAEDAAKVEEEADTYYEAGRACLYGLDGQEFDIEAAYTNFEEALEMGKTEANFYLGLLYDGLYSYPELNYERAKAYYEAAGDDLYAQLALGFLYYYGQGVEEDTIKGQELFDTVIAKGCVEGYLGSASIAEDHEDYDTALEYYNKVLEGEEQAYIAYAMYNIGDMYYYGQGVEQDYAQAMEWYEKSADMGNPTAMSNIAFMYANGEGVEQDYAKAVELFEKSADLGDRDAMNNLGYMYAYGQGVKQDYAQAMEWYRKAADLGNASAINNIAFMYANGEGVEQDYIKAIEWFEKSADLGNINAMNNLAYMYENGLGVEKDAKKAQEWRDKAAAAE